MSAPYLLFNYEEAFMQVEFILKKSGSQNLATGALSLVTAFNRRWRLTSVEVHFSADCSQVLTITKDNILGVNYDTVLEKTTLNVVRDHIFRPMGMQIFDVGDECKLEITQGGTAVAYAVIMGVEV